MKREWLALLSAIQFLTRLPVPDPGWEEGRFDCAAKWFPLVGILVGLISSAGFIAARLLGQSDAVALVIALALAVLVTGALHEDGLADTADGLGGGRDRAHCLKIMKDSSIGAYGAIALLFAFALRFFLYRDTALAEAESFAALTIVFIAAHCVGRIGMVIVVWSLDYARDMESAKVAPLTAPADHSGMLVVAATFFLAVVPVFSIYDVRAAATGLAISLIAVLLLRIVYVRKIGGWTGDTAGATQVVCEIAFLIGVAAWI